MDADASLLPVERPQVRAAEAPSGVRSRPTGLQGYSRPAQGLSFTLALIALHREPPAGRKAAL